MILLVALVKFIAHSQAGQIVFPYVTSMGDTTSCFHDSMLSVGMI